VHLDEALRVPAGLESPHASLSFTRRLVRVLGAVVQISVLSVSNAGHHQSFRGGVAAQLVRHNYSRTTITVCAQQLAEEAHSRQSVPLWLHQNINDDAVLIDGAPKIMPHTVDLQEHLI
jgi:hypothetical protein